MIIKVTEEKEKFNLLVQVKLNGGNLKTFYDDIDDYLEDLNYIFDEISNFTFDSDLHCSIEKKEECYTLKVCEKKSKFLFEHNFKSFSEYNLKNLFEKYINFITQDDYVRSYEFEIEDI